MEELGYSRLIVADPPRGEEYWIPIDPRFTHGVDLVSYIRSSPEFSSDFCLGVAGSLSPKPVEADIQLNRTLPSQPTQTVTQTAKYLKTSRYRISKQKSMPEQISS